MDPMDCPLRARSGHLRFDHAAGLRLLFFLPYLARVELQDAERPAPNMHIQPSVRGLTVIAFSRSNSANLLHSMFGFMRGQRQ